MNKKLILFSFVIIILVAIAGFRLFTCFQKAPEVPLLTNNSIKASYLCNEGKTVAVTFYKGTPKPVNPGEMPIPTGSTDLILSDGRNLTLGQTISADGGRYANSDESFVFWSKGNGALVLENNVEKSYIGCVVIAPDPGGLPNTYVDGTLGFSVRYPESYSINTGYKYQYLGPGKDIYGVEFTISATLTIGKNLSSYDTGVSIEAIPEAQDCNAGLFLEGAGAVEFASSTGAAAGNFYEEDVWTFPGTNPCIAVRYLIHSTNIDNYEPGAVKEFDRQALLEEFNKIRQSLTIR